MLPILPRDAILRPTGTQRSDPDRHFYDNPTYQPRPHFFGQLGDNRTGLAAGNEGLQSFQMRRSLNLCLPDAKTATRGVLFLLTGAIIWAQVSDRRDPAFPSESEDPRDAGGAELLEAVCPGKVTIAKGMGCLTGCSDDTAFGKFGDRFPWSLEAVTFGRFLPSVPT